MEDLRAQIDLLRQNWKQLKEDYLTEDICKSYIPGVSLSQLDEVLTIVCDFLDKVKSPKGFAPTFNLARALASGSVDAANTLAKQIRAGTQTQLPSFVGAINQTLTAFHSMLVYGDKHDAVPDLTMQMQEGLALLGTAQKELEVKLLQLKESAAIEEKLEKAADEMDALSTRATTTMESIADAQVQSDLELKATQSDRVEIQKTKTETDELLKLLQATQAKVLESEKELVDLQRRSREQSDLISKLLPTGASAGLAHAFGERARKLESTKWIWMGVFLVSITALAVIAVNIIGMHLSSNDDLWLQILHRIPLASPLVWLGWFSAVQYGNTIRVQEDYAFKEATSKAFAGYRDHMEHLAGINPDEGSSAMEILATATIEILAREPLRIYNKPDRDVTPLQALVAAWKLRREKEAVKTVSEAAGE